MPVTIPQTETVLKSYFETGDKPTQDQFSEFIGTMFYLNQQVAALAQQASDDAAEAVFNSPVALAKVLSDGGDGLGAVYTIQPGSFNVSSVASVDAAGSNSDFYRITWSGPFSDTNYKVFFTTFGAYEATSLQTSVVTILNQATTHIDVRFTDSGFNGFYNPHFNLIAYN